MNRTVVITSAVELKPAEVQALQKILSVSPTDKVIQEVDPSVIAGLRVSIDGQTVDLTVKRQLAELTK